MKNKNEINEKQKKTERPMNRRRCTATRCPLDNLTGPFFVVVLSYVSFCVSLN